MVNISIVVGTVFSGRLCLLEEYVIIIIIIIFIIVEVGTVFSGSRFFN